MFRIYAYADSSDLCDIEQTLISAFSSFAATWPVDGVLLTNKKAPLSRGQHMPDWNIGLRVTSEVISRENIDQLLSFLVGLSREVGLPFVVGTWRERSIGTKDLCIVDWQIPDGAAGDILENARCS